MSESEVTPSGEESATGTAAAEDATGIEVTGELELEWPENGFHFSLQHLAVSTPEIGNVSLRRERRRKFL